MIPALIVAALQTAMPNGDVPKYPFTVGEELQYSAKLGFLRLGTGYITVAGIDTVRGIPAFYFRFALEGGNSLYRVNSVLESWTGVADLKSLRFRQDITERGRQTRFRTYEIFPDSGYYRLEGSPEQPPTPPHPLDDASFMYFMRTQPLEVGQEYKLDLYFRTEKNPVILRVEKREEMELPDGSKVQCLVVAPIVGDRGMFAPRQEARVWLTDDERRLPVQIRTRYPFGVVTLRLEKMNQ
ncbi:MAG TPA: DUF3108 domain-containing protein [Gemmatimonadales bacterium]|nr:DUF3108 domain-containing protein [Gemmatimonadales bacterium]